ncbi:MAG TPA: hypothetical protein VN043_08405 [Rhodanobacter sp.]|nr:hypothetical protein [Rhodanobacter sp.]
MKVLRCLSSPGCLLLLVGCATQPTAHPRSTGDASWQVEAPAASQRYQLAAGAIATGANAARTVTPSYPASELAACPPLRQVRALLIVDGTGTVAEVRIADGLQADKLLKPFNQAVRDAALQWRFNPLQVQHPGFDAQHDPVVVSEVRPFSMSYVFRFTCHAGKATVTGERGPADRS